MTEEMPGHWYDAYDRGRPGYPDDVLALVELAPSATVLDLAAGTGILSRQLSPRVASVVAVEPDPGMRRLLASRCPSVRTLDGTAERIPLPNDSVDAAFVAQAFHWFDTQAALEELARVLRPGGALVVLWNVADGPTEPSITGVEELLRPVWPKDFNFPLDMMSGGWAPTVWELPFAQATFEDVRVASLTNVQTVDADDVLAFFGSMGWVASLPNQQRRQLMSAIRTNLSAAEYKVPWQTRVQWTRLIEPT